MADQEAPQPKKRTAAEQAEHEQTCLHCALHTFLESFDASYKSKKGKSPQTGEIINGLMMLAVDIAFSTIDERVPKEAAVGALFLNMGDIINHAMITQSKDPIAAITELLGGVVGGHVVAMKASDFIGAEAKDDEDTSDDETKH